MTAAAGAVAGLLRVAAGPSLAGSAPLLTGLTGTLVIGAALLLAGWPLHRRAARRLRRPLVGLACSAALAAGFAAATTAGTWA